MTDLIYPTYIYVYIILFFASQFVFFTLVICGYCFSVPFFTSRLELGPGTSYWVSTVLSLIFSVLSWISFRFWTWRRNPTILKWMCPIFALGLGLDVIIALPFAIQIEESSNSKLLRILPLFFGSLSTIYMVSGWLCLARYTPLTIPPTYEPLANTPDQGDELDLVPSPGVSAGRCETLFSAQLRSYEALKENHDEKIQPIKDTARLTSVSNATQFNPALVFWQTRLNPFRALIVALPVIMVWSGVNMAYQISSYYKSGEGRGSTWILLFAYPTVGIILPPLLILLVWMRVDFQRHIFGPVTARRSLGVLYLVMIAMSTAGLILTDPANAPWGIRDKFLGWLIVNSSCLILYLLFGVWWMPDWASWKITHVVLGVMNTAAEGLISWVSSAS